MWASLKRLLLVIPAMCVLALTYLFICFSCAGLVELQLVLWGFNKTVSLGVSLGVAIGVYFFVVLNHRIREFIDQRRSG